MRFIETLEKPNILQLADVLKYKKRLHPFFKKLPVELVFVHGSLAKDRLRPLSDIDVAVLFKEGRYRFKPIAKIADRLSELLGREDIDLAVLNRASPVLRMQVLVNGKIIFRRSQKVFKNFRFHTLRHYLSTQFLRARFRQYAKHAILGGGT